MSFPQPSAHTSPMPSPLASVCGLLAAPGQLSIWSCTESQSTSVQAPRSTWTGSAPDTGV
jgi:hypothetical protein